MIEDLSKASAFLNKQAYIHLIGQSVVPAELPTPEERRIDNLILDLVSEFGINSCLLDMNLLAQPEHPLASASIVTPSIPLNIDGVEAELMAGCIPVSRVDSAWTDDSERVLIGLKTGNEIQRFTLINVDSIGRITDRFGYRFSSEQLAGCEAVLRRAMENGDPNSQDAAWGAYMERLLGTTSIERINILTMG